MIGVTMEVRKAADVRRWAEGLPDEFHKRTSLLVGSYALRIEREAKRAAPVAANILRSSIHTDIRHEGKRTVARVGTDVHYGPYVEYGTGLYGPKQRAYEIRPKNKKALAFVQAAGMELATGRALYRKTRVSLTTKATAKGVFGGQVATQLRPGVEGIYKVGKLGKALYRKRTTRLVKTAKGADKTVVRKVIHPGVRPRPFLHPVFDRLMPFFMNDMRQLVTHFGEQRG